MKTRPVLWLSLAVAGVGFGACAGLTATTLPANAPTGTVPAASSVASGVDAAQAELSKEPLDLEHFTPILADPRLKAAAKAALGGQPGLAARHLEAVMTKLDLPAEPALRWHFLLGRLRESAGELEGAAASYQMAAKRTWALSDYARMGAGRMQLRRGHPEKALTELRQISLSGAIMEPARLLLADAAALAGEYTLAIANYKAHLLAENPSEKLRVSLRLAETLLSTIPLPEEPLDATARAGNEAKAHDMGSDVGAVAKPVIEHPPNSAELSVEQRQTIIEALRLARRAGAMAVVNPREHEQAVELERRALLLLPKSERAKWEIKTPEDELARMNAYFDAGQYGPAEKAAEELLKQLGKEGRFSTTGCQAQYIRAKAIAGQRKWGKATDSLNAAIGSCHGDTDYRAKILYLAGKYAAADNRHSLAIRRFAQVEKEAPTHRLADDSRLRAARSYLELGSEARFTELLSEMPRDYPHGDMVLDGIFELALRRIEKGDWSGAASVLDRGAELVQGRDSARGTEFSGRERYFRARAWAKTGQPERALEEYEAIVRQLPLSYYMLHAYSRLISIDPARAKRAREAGIRQAKEKPFAFEYRPEFDTPAFGRALELLRVGEENLAKRELAELGVGHERVAPGLLWAVALLYERAGIVKSSHSIARGLLTDWLERWPAGDWTRAWQIAFPRPYREIVTRESKKRGVPEALIYGVMREESAFDKDAVSPAAAHGLMQLIVPTARGFAKPLGLPWDPVSLTRPNINITLGTRVLSKLRERFEENPLLAIPGYNAGPGRPVRWVRERPSSDFDIWVELIPFNETRRYTKRVLASQAAYAVLYEPEYAEQALKLPLKVAPATDP